MRGIETGPGTNPEFWHWALGMFQALQMLQLLEPFGTSQKTTKTTTKTTQNHPDLRDLLGERHAFEQMVADPGTWAWSPSEASRLPVEPSGATTGTCHASVGKLGTVPVTIQMQLEAVAMVHRTSLEVSEYHWVSVYYLISLGFVWSFWLVEHDHHKTMQCSLWWPVPLHDMTSTKNPRACGMDAKASTTCPNENRPAGIQCICEGTLLRPRKPCSLTHCCTRKLKHMETMLKKCWKNAENMVFNILRSFDDRKAPLLCSKWKQTLADHMTWTPQGLYPLCGVDSSYLAVTNSWPINLRLQHWKVVPSALLQNQAHPCWYDVGLCERKNFVHNFVILRTQLLKASWNIMCTLW